MEKMLKALIVFSAISFLLIANVAATDVSYQIRSNVYDNTDSTISPGDFYWDANSYPGFWYKIKPGLSGEVLYMHNSANSSAKIKLGDRIAEGDLYYISKPQIKKTKIGGFNSESTYRVDETDLKKYYLMGFFGSQYIVMPEDPSDLLAGCKPDKIAKILMETDSDDKTKLFSGEKWELKDGWSLVAQQVDVDGEKVWLELRKDGETIDTEVVSTKMELEKTQRTYLYKDSDDYPIFYCYVDSIFRGQDSDFVMLNYAFLRGDITTIDSDESYGIFDVDGFTIIDSYFNGTDIAGSGSATVLNMGDKALVMSSNEDIILDADKKIDLHAGMYIQTEDTSSPCLKMTLRKTCTIEVPDCQECENDESEAIAVTAEENVKASFSEQEETPVYVSDRTYNNESSESYNANIMQGSVKSPGFELIFGIIGIIGAFRLRK
ncbi:S-layer protein domain-containing protein [Methanolobus sp. ZRKC3]|uniref:S-layer protein domain-containing protein n=1 Tax=Methanolobus sp. ZRKC3 TaxID=3125786 RepID=UPI00324E1682